MSANLFFYSNNNYTWLAGSVCQSCCFGREHDPITFVFLHSSSLLIFSCSFFPLSHLTPFYDFPLAYSTPFGPYLPSIMFHKYQPFKKRFHNYRTNVSSNYGKRRLPQFYTSYSIYLCKVCMAYFDYMIVLDL